MHLKFRRFDDMGKAWLNERESFNPLVIALPIA
jgi:hypothetical protein